MLKQKLFDLADYYYIITAKLEEEQRQKLVKLFQQTGRLPKEIAKQKPNFTKDIIDIEPRVPKNLGSLFFYTHPEQTDQEVEHNVKTFKQKANKVTNIDLPAIIKQFKDSLNVKIPIELLEPIKTIKVKLEREGNEEDTKIYNEIFKYLTTGESTIGSLIQQLSQNLSSNDDIILIINNIINYLKDYEEYSYRIKQEGLSYTEEQKIRSNLFSKSKSLIRLISSKLLVSKRVPTIDSNFYQYWKDIYRLRESEIFDIMKDIQYEPEPEPEPSAEVVQQTPNIEPQPTTNDDSVPDIWTLLQRSK